MADSTAPAAPKVLTPPRPSAVAKPPSVPPAPASRPSPPQAPQAPRKAEAPKAPEPMKAEAVLDAKIEAPAVEPAPVVIAAPPPPPPPVVAAAPAPEPVVAAAPPSLPSSPRRSLLSIVTWDAFRPEPDPLALAKLTPAVTLRRARFTKYVKGVVAGCAGLCLIALVRVAVASASEAEDPARAIVHKVHEAKSLVDVSEERAVRSAVLAAKTTSLRHH